MKRISRISAILVGLTIACAGGPTAFADDSEIYLDAVSAAQKVKPNVLLVIDTSISMQATVMEDPGPYDPNYDYPDLGGCRENRLYWVDASSGDPGTAGAPNCLTSTLTNQYITTTANKCGASTTALANTGTYYDSTDRIAHWRGPSSSSPQRSWVDLRTTGDDANNAPIDCQKDAGVHGSSTGSSSKYLATGSTACSTATDTSGCWGTSSTGYSWTGRKAYRLYTGRYLNWLYATGIPSDQTRMEVVIDAAQKMVDSSTTMRIGLMQFSRKGPGECTWSGCENDIDEDGEGGMVLKEIADVTTNADSIKTAIGGLQAETYTSSAETLYEALQYFRGGAVDYGLTSGLYIDGDFESIPSVAESRQASPNQNTYKSPIEYKCQRNYLIFLSDGLPRGDRSEESATRIGALPDWSAGVGHTQTYCDGDINGPGGQNAPDGGGRCLDDLAAYMANTDLSPLDGKQNVITYTVGFSEEVDGQTFLQDAADEAYDRSDTSEGAPRGQFFQANTSIQLNEVLSTIKFEMAKQNVTFTSPTLSVDAFNRTRTLDKVYVSLFETDTTDRWAGNVKKYKLKDAVLVDQNDIDAVDPATGFFKESAQSYWSTIVDGKDAVKGGAAGKLPEPGARKIYVGLNTGELDAAGNAFATTNSAVTDTLLGTSTEPSRDELIQWVLGVDKRDQDNDLNVTETRLRMGDPIHSRPATVTYAAAATDTDDQDEDGTVVFLATNEGLLHAIDANTGVELWSFMPKEMLGRLKKLYNNEASTSHDYGIDGEIRVLKYDINGNGTVDGDDRVLLFFGLRRGGKFYYALDVTNKEDPSLLWVKQSGTGAGQLPGLGQAWSTPTLARVQINGVTQGSGTFANQFFVLIFGGGYTEGQEHYDYTEDTEGNGIYMLDMQTGALLWRAGSDAGANLQLAADGNTMNNAIPADITVVDLDGDQFADRMYAGDMGGRIWRFDIFNGNPASTLVTGGVIARLGAGDMETPTIADSRRFYNRPDVALVERRGVNPFFNIAMGSGYRGHPLHKETLDRFYGVRDKQPFAKLDQATYDSNAATAITNADLEDVTGTPNSILAASAKGWRLDMTASGTGAGEKVLADSVTVAGVTIFPTYTPPSATVQPCDTNAFGSTRVYTIRSEDGGVVNANRSETVAVAGIAPPVTVVIGDPADSLNNTKDSDGDGTPDALDNDDDGDGILDVDDDDMDNSASLDSDNDGVPDQADDDDDNDGTDDATDTDDDGDGILDENDSNLNGKKFTDSDGDGIRDSKDTDDDNDGVLDALDSDDDGDGIPDIEEGSADATSTCWIGPKKLAQCVDVNSVIRTYWRKDAG